MDQQTRQGSSDAPTVNNDVTHPQGKEDVFAHHDDDFQVKLIQAYRQRLRIDKNNPLEPTRETLSLLVERHLEYIPFTNLSLHVTHTKDKHNSNITTPPILLEPVSALMEKVLFQGRGGCCLELNGLFAVLLEALGYPHAWKVPCFVYAGSERGHLSSKSKFRTTASHFLLLVHIPTANSTTIDSPTTSFFVVDVGLGEPPMGPLEYVLDKVQHTVDDMQSRIILDPQGSFTDRHGRNRKCVILQWKVNRKGGFRHQDDTMTNNSDFLWQHRLQWDLGDAPLDLDSRLVSIEDGMQPPIQQRSLQSFHYVIPILRHKKSTFARKLIVCKLTQNLKVSLSGQTLKRTDRQTGEIHTEQIDEDSIPLVLKEEFGIEMNSFEKITYAALNQDSSAKLWGHL